MVWVVMPCAINAISIGRSLEGRSFTIDRGQTMPRPNLEIAIEDTDLYAIAHNGGETLGVIGPIDDRDAIMATAVERRPDVDHVDLDD